MKICLRLQAHSQPFKNLAFAAVLIGTFTKILCAAPLAVAGSRAPKSIEVMSAITLGNLDQVKTYVELGLNLTGIEPLTGRPFLHLAVRNGHAEMTKYLLENGSPVDLVDTAAADQRTALYYAITLNRPDIVRILIAARASLKTTGAEHTASPLTWAAWFGKQEIVSILLDAQANLEAEDSTYGATPLMWAADAGHETTVRLLIEGGADINKKSSKENKTSLVYAIEHNRIKTVEVLLAAGARYHEPDPKSHLAPFDMTKGKPEIQVLFENHASHSLFKLLNNIEGTSPEMVEEEIRKYESIMANSSTRAEATFSLAENLLANLHDSKNPTLNQEVARILFEKVTEWGNARLIEESHTHLMHLQFEKHLMNEESVDRPAVLHHILNANLTEKSDRQFANNLLRNMMYDGEEWRTEFNPPWDKNFQAGVFAFMVSKVRDLHQENMQLKKENLHQKEETKTNQKTSP